MRQHTAPGAAATPAAAVAPPDGSAALAITPLAGPAPRYGAAALAAAAAAAGHATPAQQQHAVDRSGSEQVHEQQQQLSITPLTGHARSSSTAPAAQTGAVPSPASQLRHAAPAPLDMTPLAAPPASRLPSAFAAAPAVESAEPHAARPPSISPFSSTGSQAAGHAPELCISPLPGMEPRAALPRQPLAQRAGRSVLGERSTNNPAAPASPRALPPLASPLPAHAEPPALQDSPSFAENLPLPSPPPQRGGASKLAQHKQQPTPADTHTHKIKAAAAAAAESAVAELQPTSLGSFQPWTISAVPGGELASGSSSDEVPAAAARLQPSGSGEFSFAAAQRSAEQLAAGGAVWAAGCQAAGEVAGGGAAAAAALQDNLLAMHLDMLSQFQVGCRRLKGGASEQVIG